MRPAGRALIQEVKPGDHIIFYSIERGFRNTSEMASFCEWSIQQGIHLHFVYDSIDISTPNGRLIAHIKAAIAEWYSSILSQRIKEANIIKRLRAEGKKKEQKTKPKWDAGNYITQSKKPIEKKGGRVFRYIRCSHIDSYTSGLGLEYQEQRVTEWAELLRNERGYEVMEKIWEDDAVSAFKKDFITRKEAKELDSLLQPGDHVVIYRLDRGFRTVRDMINTEARWRAMGVTLHICDPRVDSSTQQGRDMLSILSMVAESESHQKSVRNSEICQRIIAEGRPHDGRPKLGHKIIKRQGKLRIIPDPEEIAYYLAFKKLREAGWTKLQAGEYIYAVWCWKNEKAPIPYAVRTQKGHQDFSRKSQRGIEKLDSLLNGVGEAHTLVEDIALKYLTASIPETFFRFSKVPNPACDSLGSFRSPETALASL